MKNSIILTFCFFIMAVSSFGQATGPAETKKNQYDVLNDFYIEYGYGSVYFYIDQGQNNAYSFTSPGSFIFGYTRSLNKVIGVGFMMCYTPVTAKYNHSTSGTETMNYNYVQALARVKFQYMNKPSFAMYSGVAIGVTMDYYYETTTEGRTNSSQTLLPAGQLTLLGFRVGRSAAFMGEFGIGTISILNLGFSYKFGN